MDPTEALIQFLEDCVQGRKVGAALSLNVLNDWIKRRGFLPKVTKLEDGTYKVEHTPCEDIRT